jgi:hypothetical protein
VIVAVLYAVLSDFSNQHSVPFVADLLAYTWQIRARRARQQPVS